MGTPEFSVPILKELIDKYNVVLVVTMPDALVGRKKILTECPVKKLAKNNNIPVFSPDKIKNDFFAVIDYKPDIIITCAYGQLIPDSLLNYPKYGCINIHASLLPKYRGGAPIQYSIMNGDNKTGITIMYMENKMDAGNIIYQEEINLDIKDNLDTLSEKLSKLGSEMIIKYLPSIIKRENPSIKQDENNLSYAKIISREDEKLDFFNSAINIYNKVRALNSHPYAYVNILNAEYKIIECEIVEGVGQPGIISEVDKDYFIIDAIDKKIKVTKIKVTGKKVMNVKDYFNGFDKTKLLGERVNEK